jgi:choline monooxygenase
MSQVHPFRPGSRNRVRSADAARSAALPGWLYSDPAVFATEKERLFFKSWQCVGHATEVPNPGDYITTRIVDQELFVLRGADGQLRAFHNVCQHRAHLLLKGRGNIASVIVCPYHAWSYELDGSLRKARGTRGLPDFDPAEYGLEPIRLELPLGFLCVNLDPGAAPLQEVAGALFDDLAAEAPWLGALQVNPHYSSGESDALLAANWKVLAENCLECYHCAPAHKAYSDMIEVPRYHVTRHVTQWGGWMKSAAPLRRHDSSAYQVAVDAPVQSNVFWHLFPNIEFGIMPGAESLYVFRFEPVSAEESRVHNFMLTRPGAVIPADRANFFRDVLWPEDVAICESVQRGLKSRGYRGGRFVAAPESKGADGKGTEGKGTEAGDSGISEANVHEFQRLYAKVMGI